MSFNIELDTETEAMLRARAAALGIEPAELVLDAIQRELFLHGEGIDETPPLNREEPTEKPDPAELATWRRKYEELKRGHSDLQTMIDVDRELMYGGPDGRGE